MSNKKKVKDWEEVETGLIIVKNNDDARKRHKMDTIILNTTRHEKGRLDFKHICIYIFLPACFSTPSNPNPNPNPNPTLTSPMRSEHAFMTIGCWVNVSVQLTNPTSLTTFLTLSRSPPQASCKDARRLSPQCLHA